ncbi:MAG: prolipoprotein diacylglyceryl transferase [Bacteroidota bacterium]
MTGNIVWNVNPEIFRWGSFAVRWYGVLFAMGFYVSFMIVSRFLKYEKMDVRLVDSLTVYMVVGTVVGARLGHVLFYEPQLYWHDPIKVFYIWEGGLASHGGALGVLLACYLFSRRFKIDYMWVLDRIVIVTALTGMFIRTGNLMNSEIFGKPTNLPWAFEFIRDNNIPRHPTQIYEALAYLLIFGLLLWYYLKAKGKPIRGILFSAFLILLFTVRFVVEFIKEPQTEFENAMTLNMGQWLSIPFILTGVGLMVYFFKKNKNVPKANLEA